MLFYVILAACALSSHALTIEVGGASVWSGGSVPQWTAEASAPFVLGSSSRLTVVSEGAQTCVRGLQLVPVAAAPAPATPAAWLWSGTLYLAGAPAGAETDGATLGALGSALAAFLSLPSASVRPGAPVGAAIELPFSATAYTPEQQEAALAALGSVTSSVTAASSSSDGAVPPIGPLPAQVARALLAYLKAAASLPSLTYADLVNLQTAFGGAAGSPSAPLAPFPPLAPPATRPHSNTTLVGCSAFSGGALVDLQVYAYALSPACAQSLASGVSGGCGTSPPAPPAPASPPPAVWADAFSSSDTLGSQCGPARFVCFCLFFIFI